MTGCLCIDRGGTVHPLSFVATIAVLSSLVSADGVIMVDDSVSRQEIGVRVDFDWILEGNWITLAGESPPTFSALLRLDNGEIVRMRGALRNLTSGQTNTASIRLSAGTLIFASITPVDDVYTPGQNFASLSLLSPPVEGERDRRMLASGPITRLIGVSWPGGFILDPLSSIGINEVQLVNAPAAGANFGFTYPANSRARIAAVEFTLSTSAVVAGRRAGVQLLSSGVVVVDSYDDVVQSANTVVSYRLTTQSIAPQNEAISSWFPLPEIVIDNGRIQSNVLALQAGDQLSAIRVYRNLTINSM